MMEIGHGKLETNAIKLPSPILNMNQLLPVGDLVSYSASEPEASLSGTIGDYG